MKHNEKLRTVGLSQEDHTGVPWLFTIATALKQIFDAFPELVKKSGIAQFTNFTHSTDVHIAYNNNANCMCNQSIFDAIDYLAKNRSTEMLNVICTLMNKDKCYAQYAELIEKQYMAGDVANTVKLIVYEIISHLWPEEEDIKKNVFNDELLMMKMSFHERGNID